VLLSDEIVSAGWEGGEGEGCRGESEGLQPSAGWGNRVLLKARLYLETTVPSYLTAWPSQDLIRAGHQQITREWWAHRRGDFDVFISQLVLTWNCAHIANAERALAIETCCGDHGLDAPVICTPEELMGD